ARGIARRGRGCARSRRAPRRRPGSPRTHRTRWPRTSRASLPSFLFVERARLAVAGVGLPVAGDLLLVAVPDGEKHRLRVVEVAALLAVVLERARLDDGVDRAGLLAEAAEDALHEVDVVAGGAPGAVLAHVGLDVDGERRADGLAELAGDAALFPVRVAPQGVQAAEARAHGRLFLGELHRDLAREEVAPGERHAAQKLEEQEAAEEFDEARHRQRLQGVCIQMPITAIQTSVTGMKTFQPSRMIWS